MDSYLDTRSYYMRKWVVFLVISICLAGCSSLRRGVNESDLFNAKRVGVVSLLGSNFHGTLVSGSTFISDSFVANVNDWTINRFTSDEAVRLLQGNTQFESVRVNVKGYTLTQLQASDNQAVFDLASSQGIDTVVLIRPDVSHKFVRFEPGYGLYEHSVFHMGSRCVYAAYTVNVYAVASRELIGWQWGGDSDAPCRLDENYPVPFKISFSNYSKSERNTLRADLEARIKWSLQQSLAALRLITL
jgi:hypothetical protein